MKKLDFGKLPTNKSILKVALALILAISIIAGSMQISIRLTRERMEDYAEYELEQKSAYLNSVTEMIFKSNEWVINSFLTGLTRIEHVDDSAANGLRYRQVLDDKVLKVLAVEDFFDKLDSFIDYNNDFLSAIIIIEPNVLNGCSDGIVVADYSSDDDRDKIPDVNQVFDDAFYGMVKKSGKPVVRSGFIKTDSLLVLTTAVPLYNERGCVIGEFWVDADAQILSEMLNNNELDDDLLSLIVDDDCVILAGENAKYNGRNLIDVIDQSLQRQNLQQWYDELKTCVLLDSLNQFKCKIGDESFVTYVFPINNSTFNLLVIKPESKIYSAVKRFTSDSFIIMIVSILLIFAFLTYIFFVFKKKNDDNNKMEKELDVASEIQRSILPPNPQGNDNQQYDIYGFQHPAKSVGGDLYDFVRKGDYLHFCIGDVSGKGIPSALVMTELCSLYRYIIRNHLNPQEIVSLINQAVMERSDDSMFCTLLVGVLNLKTGLLEFCNAGHNPPILIPSDGTIVNYLKVKPNMPIYAFEDYCYQKESLQMNPGDRLFIYTDGVTEAKNDDDKFFGNAATLESVQNHRNLPFSEMVSGVLDDVKSFANKTEQNDDITILCVEYKGHGELSHYHFDSVKQVVPIVNTLLEACQASADMRLRLALEESVQNVADYAYADDGYLDVSIEKENGFLIITLCDGGEPFNPLEIKEPVLDMPIEDRKVGGLGIHFVRKIMDKINYRFENQQNKLILKYRMK